MIHLIQNDCSIPISWSYLSVIKGRFCQHDGIRLLASKLYPSIYLEKQTL